MDVPRIALSMRTILYRGSDLNALVARGLERGATPGTPSGACAGDP